LKTRASHLIAGSLAFALFASGLARADGIIFHIDCIPADVLNALVDDWITTQEGQQQIQETGKAATQAATQSQFGAAAAADLQAGSLPTSAAALSPSVTETQQSAKVSSDPTLKSYLSWSATNRTAIGGVNQQIANAVAQNNGQPLDYSHQTQLASQFGALQNQSLALAVTDQNSANEARIQMAQQKQQILTEENSEQMKDGAQAELNSRLNR
jgi:hypothetical protein